MTKCEKSYNTRCETAQNGVFTECATYVYISDLDKAVIVHDFEQNDADEKAGKLCRESYSGKDCKLMMGACGRK